MDISKITAIMLDELKRESGLEGKFDVLLSTYDSVRREVSLFDFFEHKKVLGEAFFNEIKQDVSQGLNFVNARSFQKYFFKSNETEIFKMLLPRYLKELVILFSIEKGGNKKRFLLLVISSLEDIKKEFQNVIKDSPEFNCVLIDFITDLLRVPLEFEDEVENDFGLISYKNDLFYSIFDVFKDDSIFFKIAKMRIKKLVIKKENEYLQGSSYLLKQNDYPCIAKELYSYLFVCGLNNGYLFKKGCENNEHKQVLLDLVEAFFDLDLSTGSWKKLPILTKSKWKDLLHSTFLMVNACFFPHLRKNDLEKWMVFTQSLFLKIKREKINSDYNDWRDVEDKAKELDFCRGLALNVNLPNEILLQHFTQIFNHFEEFLIEINNSHKRFLCRLVFNKKFNFVRRLIGGGVAGQEFAYRFLRLSLLFWSWIRSTGEGNLWEVELDVIYYSFEYWGEVVDERLKQDAEVNTIYEEFKKWKNTYLDE